MPRRAIFWTLAALAASAAAWQAWNLRWTCDDAYISFRYAQHLVEGHGLVFNLDPAEPPVEGYSNFTWTIWLAIGQWLGCTGAALETWSNVWGTLCYAATVWLLAFLAWRGSAGRAVAPIAACGYAAVHHAASLAPAGLETALYVMLVTTLLRFAIDLRCARQAAIAGLVAALTAMTRPDGLLPAAILGAFVALDARARRAPALFTAYAVPFGLAFGPFLIWRRSYYGYWLPNTFYAKSDGGPLLGLGVDYVVEFAKCYWALAPALLALAWLAVSRTERRRAAAIAAFVLPYLAFVVWVGGDFMFARFLLPILPALLLALDGAFVRARTAWVQPLVAAAVAAGLVLRSEPPWLGDYNLPVSDNRRFTMAEMRGVPGVSAAEAFRRAGEALRVLFDGLPVRVGIGGGQANLAYRSRVPVAVECAAGLTDAYLAHLPGKQRHKVAHNLDPSHYTGYLERRGVHFMFEGNYDKHVGEDGTTWVDDAPWRQIWFPSDAVDWSPIAPIPVPARLAVYDRDLMRELRERAPTMVAVDFEKFLDDYVASLPTKTKDQVRADYERFRRVWFDHTPDPVRQKAFEDWLR